MPADDRSALDALTLTLDASPPDSVAALPADVLLRLIDQIEAGRRAHDRAGMAAIDAALHNVPLPFRGIVRKALR